MSINHFTPNVGNQRSSGLFFQTLSPLTDATAGVKTYTAKDLFSGIILRDPAGGNRSDVLPAAADICAAINGVMKGTAFYVDIRNTADAAETITMTAGTGGTTSGTMTIAQNNGKSFLIVITSIGTDKDFTGATYTIYSLGTYTA